MTNTTLYSIGHGNKKIEDFIMELQEFNICYLIDVRSIPFSKWNPQFNQHELKATLQKQQIIYVYLGDKLGGIPKDKSCYTHGKVDYRKIKEKPFFKEGIERLITANNKKIHLAIMCSETNPKYCHRSKLIGQTLLENNISLNHIISKHIKSQEDVINELTNGIGIVNLFGEINIKR